VKRGEIYTAADEGPDVGKHTPVVILEEERADAAGFSPGPLPDDELGSTLVRLAIEPSERGASGA
jgi:mRNA-degrading endonuclease toxin of MazEF toxin-antitoxin module